MLLPYPLNQNHHHHWPLMWFIYHEVEKYWKQINYQTLSNNQTLSNIYVHVAIDNTFELTL